MRAVLSPSAGARYRVEVPNAVRQPFALEYECPRCAQCIAHGQLRTRRHIEAGRRWWQLSHAAVEMFCPGCGVRVRFSGIGRFLVLAGVAFGPWLLAGAWWNPQGLLATAFLLSAAVPLWVTWHAARALLHLELADPSLRFVPHWVVRQGPAPQPELPTHLGWLRVIAPGLLPIYQRLTRIGLWGVGVPLLLTTIAAQFIGSFASPSDPGFVALGVILSLVLAIFAIGSALPAILAVAFIHQLATGRVGPHLCLWWKLRSALFVAGCLGPAILFASSVADLLRLAMLAFERSVV